MIGEKTVILGAGEIGQAIGSVLRRQGLRVRFWDKNPAIVPNQEPLATLLSDAHFLFLCVPSWAFREALSQAKPYLKNQTIVVSLAKGMEQNSYKTSDQILEEVLDRKSQFAILGGAMLAEELKQGKIGTGLLASSNREVFDKILRLFQGSNIHLESSSDVHGVALASVLKNIYALALGIADGLSWDGNAKGWLTEKALEEMVSIGEYLGAKRETILGSAGLGDFVATGFSKYSLNRKAGEDIVRTGKVHSKSEGTVSLTPLIQLISKKKGSYIMLQTLEEIVINQKPAARVFNNLIQ